jgi:pilus assembly protein TadC
MSKSTVISKNPGLLLVATYLLLFLTNSVIISLANYLFPLDIVLGTATLSYFWAIALSMGKFSLIGTFAVPFVREYERHSNKMFTAFQWTLLYLVLNTVSL